MVRHGGKTSQRKLGTDEGAFTRTRKPFEGTDASITTITNERIGQFIQKVSITYRVPQLAMVFLIWIFWILRKLLQCCIWTQIDPN